jgi:hypothetical protein
LLFFNDLGTGLPNFSDAYCEEFLGGLVAAAGGFKCVLEHGDSVQGRAARVKISNFTALAAGAGRQIRLPKYKNPQLGGDDRNVNIKVLLERTDESVLEERTVYDCYLSKNNAVATPAVA